MSKKNRHIDIIYRDGDIVVINKPGGLLAVPGRGPQKQDCAAARLRQLLPTMITQPAVHRLDMHTSGVMVYAVTRESHRFLSMQFEKRKVEKKYIALVQGNITDREGEIRLPFRLDPNNRPHQIHDPVLGKMAITFWRKIGFEKKGTRINFIPITGRTHQLRVHAAHPLGLNAPIVGDSLYGSGKDGDRMFLHATFLKFLHPSRKKFVEFYSSPPF